MTAADGFTKLPHVFDMKPVVVPLAHESRKAKFARRIMSLNRPTQGIAVINRPGGRTLNDCWMIERSWVQTQGLQTLTSAYFSLVEPVTYFGSPVDLAGWSSRQSA